MLRKLFGLSGPGTSDSHQVNEALSQIVLHSPFIVRAALVTSTSLARGTFPRETAEPDRITAMSAAMLSLGERICRELGSGQMRYAIIAGERTIQLLSVLNQDYMLELELRPNASIDETLATVTDHVKQVLLPIL